MKNTYNTGRIKLISAEKIYHKEEKVAIWNAFIQHFYILLF